MQPQQQKTAIPVGMTDFWSCYQEIKNWFLGKFPEIVEFGIEGAA